MAALEELRADKFNISAIKDSQYARGLKTFDNY